ncbi:hypothetical protein TR51_06685 [Kitasatospora griseola]|uniref:Uncharacterized protein n=1 Tax=Kitasatospora griseola TaxID=2064 RepID=A0A0D0Q3C7_KITGR|nr:hypothetical protein [Kitasatospora griseola]KIQ67062.1 hypothetical protein TR51_06685 [Kitasatospora griseola]
MSRVHIAPLAAGWQRRLGGQAGPLGPVSAGSGESPTGQPLLVELFVDGLWTDITPYVMTRDGSGSVSIARGQPDEGASLDPARCTFQLNNRDGRFSPRNPSSPYFGKLGRNQPLRVSVPSGNDRSYRFWGEVASWPQRWDTTGVDVWVDLDAAGPLRRLGQGQAQIGSTLYVALAGGETVNQVVAYWPCEDSSTSTSIASATAGVQDLTINGSPSLGSFTSFACSAPLPVMHASGTFTGIIPAYPAPVATMLRFLIAIPSTGAGNNTALCFVNSTGSVKAWDVYYSTAGGGTLGLRGRDATGYIVYDSGASGFALDGQLAQVSMELVQNGPDINCALNVMIIGQSGIAGPSGTASSQTVGSLTYIAIGGASVDTAVGHVRIQTSSAAPTDQFDLQQQLVAYAGETAADRISRLCGLVGADFELIGSASDTVAMGVQTSTTVLDLVEEAALADGGKLFERTSAAGLGYRTRVSMENQSAGLTLSYAAANLAQVPTPVDDDQYTRNDITASRKGGSSARATLTEGPMSVLPPPAGVGRYDTTVALNVQSDDSLADQAGWRMHLGTTDEARFPQISVNLAHPSFTASSTLRSAALALKSGDRLAITDMPAWSPNDVSQLVLGWAESIDHFQHRITFNCQPESPYRTAVLDSATYGRLDTGGSSVAVAAGPSDTSVLVATLAGPLWTTSPGDFPFDVVMGGEQVAVTNIVGATSPQTFTVTRSVNGVTKTLPVGADVRLAQPMILAL